VIEIVDPGPQTTVQDLGRYGCLRYGIPPAGPMDRYAFVLANRLAGNADGSAALECTLAGPRFAVIAPCTMAVTGAAMPVVVNGAEVARWSAHALERGDVVKLGFARSGARAYVAFHGGLDIPLALGSRSTYLRGRLGGLGGRALRRGDRLALVSAPPTHAARIAREAVPAYESEPTVRVVLGPQADRFTPHAISTFLASAYEMLPQSDRMGARLRGPRLAHMRGHDIISDGIALGSVQVPGDGQPIILMVDRQSTGGYTKIATVCSFDIGRIAQLKPGRTLRFEAVSVEQAHRLLEEATAQLEAALEP
jgi:antagonist of KipI